MVQSRLVSLGLIFLFAVSGAMTDANADSVYTKFCKIGFNLVRETQKVSPNEGKPDLINNCSDEHVLSVELKREKSRSGPIMYKDNPEDEKNYFACLIGVGSGSGSLKIPGDGSVDQVAMITKCLNGSKEIVATRLYLPSCTKGSSDSCYRLGFIEQKENHDKEAMIHFKLACDRTYLMGCNGLGALKLKSGERSEALKLFKKGCDGGLPSSCENYKRQSAE